MYNVLEARIEWEGGRISRITVLVEFSMGDIRAITATNQPRAGYMTIIPNATPTDTLLQEVAGYGMETDPSKFFPKSKHLERA